jgi:methionine-rich copper-binding protein CopC
MEMNRLRTACLATALFAAAIPVLRAGEVRAAPAGLPAGFHTRLLRAQPAADTTISSPPAAIRLWFSEAPEVRVGSIRLTGPDGRPVSLGPVHREQSRGAPLAADVRGRMAPGRYAVTWRTMSHDGHAIHGTIRFTLATPRRPR